MLTTRTRHFPAPEDDRGAFHDAVEAALLTLVGAPPYDTRNSDVD
jgi:hypothetical protein